MINQYIVDLNGNLIYKSPNSIKAFSNNSTIIEIVAPFDIRTNISVDFQVKTDRIKKIRHYAVPAIDGNNNPLKGGDVIDKNNPNLQNCHDWNVWRLNLKQTLLFNISTHRAEVVKFSIIFRKLINDYVGNNIGKFGMTDDLPEIASVNDYMVCERYGYYSKVADAVFTKDEIAFYHNDKWNTANNFILINATDTIEVTVDPVVYDGNWESVDNGVQEQIDELKLYVEDAYNYILEVFQKQVIHTIMQDFKEIPIEDGMVNINLSGFLKNPQYDYETHTFTMDINNGNQFKIDFPIEALIENIELSAENELVLTFEDGTVRSIPLNVLLVGVIKSINGKFANALGQIGLTQDDINPLDKDFSNPTDSTAPTTKNVKTYIDAMILDIISNTIKVNNTLIVDGKITSTTGDINFDGSYAKNLKTIMELDDDDVVANKGYVDTEISKIELGTDNVKLTGNQTINGVKTFTSRPKFNEKNIVVEGDTVRRLAEGVTTGQMWSSGESNIASLLEGQERDIKIVFTIKGANGASVAQIGFTDNEIVYRMGYIGNQPHAWRRISGTVDTRSIDTIKIKKYANNKEITFNSKYITLVAEKYSNFKLTILGSINVTLNGDYETINIPAFDKGIPIAYFLTKLENGKHILTCPEHETDKYLLTVYEN